MGYQPAKTLDAGKESIEDAPLFGGPRQKSMFDDDAPGKPHERGAASLDFLTGGISHLLNPPGPRGNYSAFGNVKDQLVRNLSQLGEASPKAHATALQAAGSKGATKALLSAAVPKIENTLKANHGPSWDEMRAALVESRLEGTKERWQDLAQHAQRAGEAGLAQDFDGGGILTLLQALEGKGDIPRDAWQTALSLYQQTGIEGLQKQEAGLFPGALDAERETPEHQAAVAELRKFLADTFTEAADSAERVLTPEEYDRITTHPAFAKGLQQYKDLIEGPLAENHAANEGIFSTALGPLKTYYPLIPFGRESGGGGERGVAYRKPANQANEFATGISPLGFDTGMTPLAERLASAVRGNNRAALVQTLQDQGILQPIGPADRRQTMQWNGQEYAATRVEMQPARLVVAHGKALHMPAKMGLLPQAIAAELPPLLEQGTTRMPEGAISKALAAANKFALSGPLDLVFHSANLLGALVGNTPFAGTDLLSKTIGNTPFTNIFTAIINTANTDPTPECLFETDRGKNSFNFGCAVPQNPERLLQSLQRGLSGVHVKFP